MVDSVTVPVLTQNKEPMGEMSLPAGAFDGPVRRHLIYETIKMQRANRRAGTAATKTRVRSYAAVARSRGDKRALVVPVPAAHVHRYGSVVRRFSGRNRATTRIASQPLARRGAALCSALAIEGP